MVTQSQMNAQMRLQRYSQEFNDINAQNQMLQAQVSNLEQEMGNLQAVLRGSNDREARNRYVSLHKQYQSLVGTINRNNSRLQTLSRQIATEQNKIVAQQQKQLMSQYKKNMKKAGYHY